MLAYRAWTKIHLVFTGEVVLPWFVFRLHKESEFRFVVIVSECVAVQSACT